MDPMQTPIKIPSSWTHTPKTLTRTDLLSNRRKEMIPDPSFDLDGDGAVGAHDLVLASKFDFDRDGKLNSREKQFAQKMLSQGYASQFVWGCESSGLNRSFRLVQKRGKVIADEDFGKIRDTYPKLDCNERKFTKSELEEQRKQESAAEAKKNEQRVNTTTKMLVPLESFLCKEHYVQEPKFSSIKRKRENEVREARAKIGLSMDPIDIKTAGVEYLYNENPQNLSLSDIKTMRKTRLVNSLNNSADFDHVTFYEKVENERQYIGAGDRVLKDVMIERKKKDVGHFERTFRQRTHGIHGKELPKFEENRNGFINEEDLVRNQNFSNPFENYLKEYHKIEPKTEEITKKPTEVVHGVVEYEAKNKLNSKWSAFYSNFMPQSSRNQESFNEKLQLIKGGGLEKKQFRFLSVTDITPPITQRLLQKNYSPTSRFKSITSTGFSLR